MWSGHLEAWFSSAPLVTGTAWRWDLHAGRSAATEPGVGGIHEFQASAEGIVDVAAIQRLAAVILDDLEACRRQTLAGGREIVHHERWVRLRGGAEVSLDPQVDGDGTAGEPGTPRPASSTGLATSRRPRTPA